MFSEYSVIGFGYVPGYRQIRNDFGNLGEDLGKLGTTLASSYMNILYIFIYMRDIIINK